MRPIVAAAEAFFINPQDSVEAPETCIRMSTIGLITLQESITTALLHCLSQNHVCRTVLAKAVHSYRIDLGSSAYQRVQDATAPGARQNK